MDRILSIPTGRFRETREEYTDGMVENNWVIYMTDLQVKAGLGKYLEYYNVG
jgi:hypothetical protein